LSRPRGFPLWVLANIVPADSDPGIEPVAFDRNGLGSTRRMAPSTSVAPPLDCFWPAGTGLDGLRFFICVSFVSPRQEAGPAHLCAPQDTTPGKSVRSAATTFFGS
jgi:hypothetical protein